LDLFFDTFQHICTRSFNSTQSSLKQLQEAVSCYTARAAEKMRVKQICCARLQVFLRTNGFSKTDKQYSNACQISLTYPSLDTGELIVYALEKIYRPGYSYKKAGVIFTELLTKEQLQPDLFHKNDITSEALM
jgi:DNA polymerase V